MTYKRCSKCKKTKKLMLFGLNRSQPDGHQNYCYQCARAYQAWYRSKNGADIRIKALKAYTRKKRIARIATLAKLDSAPKPESYPSDSVPKAPDPLVTLPPLVCKICGLELPRHQFAIRSHSPTGRHAFCKKCLQARQRAHN